MSQNREINITKLQGYLKGATVTAHEIEELLLSQEHIIWMQQREIEDLKKRLKQIEDVDVKNEQQLYIQNMNVQLKTQIEFLKSQIKEKDQLISQLTIKPLQAHSADIIQAQQHLIQQNLAFQNIIGDLQNQILNKDNVIGQLKSQERTLDQLMGQLQQSVQYKREKMGVAKQKQGINGAITELQQYPEALQELIERIIQQQKRLEQLMDEKEIEIRNLRSQLALNRETETKQHTSNQPIQQTKVNEGIKQNAVMDDIIKELENKLKQQERKKEELESNLHSLTLQNKEFEKTLSQKPQISLLPVCFEKDKVQQIQNEQLIEGNQVPQQILEVSFNQQQEHQPIFVKQPEVNTDQFVFQNQKLDDLLVELQQKLVEKQDQTEEIKKQVEQLQVQFNNIKQQKINLATEIEQAEIVLKTQQQLQMNLAAETERLIKEQQILELKNSQVEQHIQELHNNQKEIVHLQKLVEENQKYYSENIEQKNQIEDLSSQLLTIQAQMQDLAQDITIKQQIKVEASVNNNTQDAQQDELVKQHLKVEELISELEQKLAEKNERYNLLHQYVKNQVEQINIFEKDVLVNNQNIVNLEQERQRLDQIIKETMSEISLNSQEKASLEDEKKELEGNIQQLRTNIEDIDFSLIQLQNQLSEKQQAKEQIENKLTLINIIEKEELLKQKEQALEEQNIITAEIAEYQRKLDLVKQQFKNIDQCLENQKQSNVIIERELDQQQQIEIEVKQYLHSVTAQLEEMEFQIKEKNEQLEKLNDQFTKVDDETKMMESVLQLKSKELSSLHQKKENYAKELDAANEQLLQVKKEIGQKKKQKLKSQNDEEQNENELEDELQLQDKLINLDLKKNDLKIDVQRMVEQSRNMDQGEPKQVDVSVQLSQSQFNQQQILQTIKDREKRIEILELTIQTLQQQNHERNSIIPSMVQSKIAFQPSIFLDDDPLLQELQEKFMKESDLLLDLENRVKQTAERHYALSLKLQEWAEKESRLAAELDARILSVETIEQELQIVFNRQTDLESDKVAILQQIYQLEIENQELIENEANTKNKLKEKKDYIQVLYKNLIDMDQKLLQFRNRMSLYSSEGRQLAEQVEHLENEKENKQNALQSILEDLEQIEIDKKEKGALIHSIKKDIADSQEEKGKLELQFATVHSKNLSLKSQIGFEETLYQKLLSEVEILKKKDLINYKNIFTDGCTQTEYELDQFEGLLNITQFFRIQQDDILHLKQNCQLKLANIYEKETDEILNTLNTNQSLKRVIHLQQMLILCQENENNNLKELNSGRSSNLVFKSCEVSNSSQQFTLEQIDPLLNKTTVVEVQLNEYGILIGEYKIAKQWIVQQFFDYDNHLYPLGVLNIIFKISIYQVVNIALTGSKVLQLYQQIN